MAFQIPTTANAPEDVLLEFCKQLTWECTLVKGAKKRNRSWPQVIPFNNLVPYLFQAPASVRNTYFASLEKYGDFTRFFKFHAPGRNRELNDTDNWQSFESWGYELVPSQEAYLQDERYADGIFPKIHRAGPLDYLLVMYPPYFAAAFELVDQEALKKKQLEDDIKVQRQSHLSTQYAKSALSTPANFASTTTMSATSNNSNRNAATGSATTSRFTVAQATGLKNDSYTIPRNHMTEEKYKKQQIEASNKKGDMYTRGARLTYSSARDDKLCMEIEELYRKSVPSRFVTDNRKKLIDKIVNILRRQYPRIKLRVEMFGSSATGLDFADSDLDLCILVPEQYFLSDIYDMNNKQRERNSYYNMWMLAGLLKRAGMVNIAAIPRANVPICKFEDPVLQLKADINTHNDMGLENSKLIKEYTFLEPRVRPFLYAIKTFTKMHKINDSSAGTLSSYTYVLMGLFFLMTCSPPVIPNLQCLNGDNACESVTCRSRTSIPKLSIYRGKPKQFDVSFHNCVKVIGADNCVPSQCQQNLLGSTPTYWRCHNTQNIGELLVDFFTFYGMVFDYERALSVRSGATIRKLPAWRKRCDLALEDPFITDRNVAISCSIEGFKLVLSEFERAAKLLKGGVDFAMVCRPAYDPTIYHDVQMADPYQSSPQHQQRYNNRQRQRQQQQEEHIMRQEQLAHVKDTYDHHEQNLNPVDNKAFSSSNSNKKAPSPLSYAPAAAISQEKKHNRDGLSIDHERTPSSNDSLPTIIPTYSPKFVKSEAEVNTKQQKHTIELDARNTEQSTPQDELSDTDFAFAPLSQQKSLPTAKHTRNNNKQKMHEPVISTHNIEPPQPEQVVPSRTNDVKQSNNSFPSVDDDDVDKYFTPPSTLFAESSRGSSTSRKPRASAKEDRLVGTLPSDDEEENDDNYHDDNDQDDQDDYVDGEEEERQQPFTHNDIKGDDVSTAASAATTSTTTVVDRETSALPLSSTMNPAAVVVKKATMRLSDMPYYVDKLDIIDALGACGFEVITIRSELVAQDELSLFPLKEWLVRVVGGRNQDLPAWFELQDMALVRSYETRRLVAYRNVIIKATLDL